MPGRVAGRGTAVAGVARERGNVVGEEQALLLGTLGHLGVQRQRREPVRAGRSHSRPHRPSVGYSVVRNSRGKDRRRIREAGTTTTVELQRRQFKVGVLGGSGQRGASACRNPQSQGEGEGSSPFVEVLGGDVVEELAEPLDLVLLLVRDGQAGLVEHLFRTGRSGCPCAARERSSPTGERPPRPRREHQGGVEDAVLDVGDLAPRRARSRWPRRRP